MMSSGRESGIITNYDDAQGFLRLFCPAPRVECFLYPNTYQSRRLIIFDSHLISPNSRSPPLREWQRPYSHRVDGLLALCLPN